VHLETGQIVAVGTTACLGVMIGATLRMAGTKSGFQAQSPENLR
jgi:hypothetical protein